MGYRSDVAYSIRFTDKKTLNEFIALVMLKGGAETDALKECAINGSDKHGYSIDFYLDSVKWYDDYPEVQAHNWLMDYAIERFPEDAAYRFLRIGEESDDVQDSWAGDSELINWDMYISREMGGLNDTTAIGNALSVLD